MLKKLPVILSFLFAAVVGYSQTIVSTTAENRNVILEEFTGIRCQFCPDGHAIAQGLKDDNPGDVFLINIHSGGFAVPGAGQPDFRTQWGEAIDDQSGLAGYPAGTVNRQNFPGQEQGAAGTTALGRFEWVSAANHLLTDPSYLNMAVTASMDAPTNTMTILVEGFYTGDSPEASNFLNVAILQNNTLGPQTGANQGNNYNHQHRLIDMVTGQWGEEITTTSTGDFVTRTYSYNPPSNVNGNLVDLNELEIVVFMTETTQFVISGSGTLVTLNPLTSSNDANALEVDAIDPTCLGAVSPRLTVSNTGTDPITSLDVTYDVNGGTSQVFNWTGNLASLESTIIELDEITFDVQTTNVVNISLPSDDFNGNNTSDVSFDHAPDTISTIKLTVRTDTWAEEVSWNFTDSSGTIIESETYTGNKSSTAGGDDNTTFNYTVNVPEDCMTFNMIDSFGDGLTAGSGGFVKLEDANGTVLYPQGGDYGAGFTVRFDADGTLGVDSEVLNNLAVYPNPTNSVLNVKNAENSAIAVYNILGQQLYNKENISIDEQINVSQFANGAYFVKITNGNAAKTIKFIVSK